MKKKIFPLLMSVATALAAQDSPKNDVFTQKGAQSLSINSYLNTGSAINIQGNYEYFVKNAWSVGLNVYNRSSLYHASTNTNKRTLFSHFDVGLNTRYYWGLGKMLPYRCFFVEAGARSMLSWYPLSLNTFKRYNNLAFTVGLGAQVKIKNNWFAELYAGYDIYKIRNISLNYATFNTRVGLSYRFPSKK